VRPKNTLQGHRTLAKDRLAKQDAMRTSAHRFGDPMVAMAKIKQK